MIAVEIVKSPKRGSSNVVEIHRKRGPASGDDFTIDEEFARLIPQPTAAEYNELERQILKDGCRDPLVVWEQERILLDGHQRHRICVKHGLAFKTETKSIGDRSEARAFVRHAALGRRNINDPTKWYLLGCLYNDEKKANGGDRRTHGSVHPIDGLNTGGTAVRIAAEQGFSKPTVERSGRYARAIDEIGSTQPDLREAILSRSIRLTKEDVYSVAAVPPSERLALVQKLTEKKTKEPEPAEETGTTEQNPAALDADADPEPDTDPATASPTRRYGNCRARDPVEIAKDERIGKLLSEGMTTAEAAEAADVPVWRVQKAKQDLGLCRPNTLLDRIIFQARTGADSLGLVLEAIEKNHIDGNAEQWSQLADALVNARASAKKAIGLVNGRKQ